MTYVIASSIDHALACKADLGSSACWLAGGTALQLEWSDCMPHHAIIDISRIDCGPAAALNGRRLRFAATATLETLRRSRLVTDRFPLLSEAIGQVAALGVRHAATIGGNLNWRSGDLVPLFLALDACVVSAAGDTIRLATHVANPSTDLFITAVEVALPEGPVIFEKIGRRAAFSPSLVTVAAIATDNGVRCAIGGGPVSPQVMMLPAGSNATSLAGRFAAPDDAFATGAHRRMTAARVLIGHLAAWGKAA